MKVFLLICALVAVSTGCKFPPELWCSSEEIATQCKVYQQCKESVWTEAAQAAPVQLELYYESLCPDCRDFITTQLYPTYLKAGDIMNITLVPFGNAREARVGDKWQFTCQHGPLECVGNQYETCAIHLLQSIKRIMPFVHCMELSSDPETAVRSCAQQSGVSLDAIMQCSNSSTGNMLEHEMAVKTNALQPQHKYVPWIVLNGVHTEKMNDAATRDLFKLICETYQGPKPEGCPKAETMTRGCARRDLI